MSATKAISSEPVKNDGTGVVSCSRTGEFSLLDSGFNDPLTITDLENQYDGRFVEGILVRLTQTVVGG